MNFPRRGEVHLVRFDPAEGSEIRKTRPALVLQNDLGNRYGSTTIVAAITSGTGQKVYPTEVLITPPEGGLDKDSTVRLDQIRSIDKGRLIRRLGELSPRSMAAVNRAIEISLGMTDI